MLAVDVSNCAAVATQRGKPDIVNDALESIGLVGDESTVAQE